MSNEQSPAAPPGRAGFVILMFFVGAGTLVGLFFLSKFLLHHAPH